MHPGLVSPRTAHRRTRLPIALFALAALLPLPSFAAHVTDVADAMDEQHPLEVDLEATYLHARTDTRITRENLQADAAGAKGIQLVDELHHQRVIDELDFRLGVGLWHDLELHFVLPLVLHDQQDWDYATVNGASVAPISTLANNHLSISGCGAAGSCNPNGPAQPIVAAPGQSTRAGLRDPTIGIAWGPINQERELKLKPEIYPEGKPVSTWVIGFDYTLPLPGGTADDPSLFGFNAATGNGALPAKQGTESMKAHVFTLWTAFSKRYRVLDPYVRFYATAPYVTKGNSDIGSGAYDNCFHTNLLSDVATQSCADPRWKGQTGYRPPYEGGFSIGTELVAAEDLRAQQRLAFDLRADVRYLGPGRSYTQVADMLGKLTYSDEYLSSMFQLGLYGRVARWLHARVYGSVGFDSPHFLTTEAVGQDLDGNGSVTLSAGRSPPSPEQNPLYDFRLDQVGRRLRAESVLSWGVAGTLSLNF